MNPLEHSYYVAIYPSGKIIQKHLTLTEAAHYCRTFNRTLSASIAWTNYHIELYTPPGTTSQPPPTKPSRN